ncbi:hypothetical protein PP175_26770 (plasmid) [Aneurinibacillus sp. Ricciae_BoGa-3]|uniref:hypothetical protein n=1 Tax=Aneurinibacillus sp. Ricciae_BoGa-3 TaxID=3022697 RepID=UPI00233FF420|nr:hypothetical protein [Aneurinibacillus sp. Ricciae_BoGa-3]WCK57642.1 hypothetical protein PP175_26770 [Aneurinibacillus sp. Ricciae_BoGa-3]
MIEKRASQQLIEISNRILNELSTEERELFLQQLDSIRFKGTAIHSNMCGSLDIQHSNLMEYEEDGKRACLDCTAKPMIEEKGSYSAERLI